MILHIFDWEGKEDKREGRSDNVLIRYGGCGGWQAGDGMYNCHSL